MVISADTSFLFSLYGNDGHSTAAAAWLANITTPIYISAVTEFELRNALRFSEFCRRVPPGTALNQIARFDHAAALGRVILSPLHLTEVLAEASRLSTAHTLTGGHRGFDILHVAAAKIIGATHFLTFDTNQKALAAKEGFITPL
jgi:predicted nucleic acid-binding protein